MHKKNFHLTAFGILLIFLFASIPANAQFQRGEKSVGARFGYVSTNESATMGLLFQYTISRHLRLAPEVSCVFKHHHRDAFSLDLNLHTPFPFSGDKFALYPLAGLNYSSWNVTQPKQIIDEMDDVSTRYSRIGLNLGAGFELRCSRTLKLGIEAKYTLTKRFSGAYVSALIGYIF